MARGNGVLPYEKDQRLDEILADVNRALERVERQHVSGFDEPQYPVIFIAGTQRSGTTLLMQLLIACFELGYVSNLAARFWQAPYIGALLFDELRRKRWSRSPDFTSELGTTYGYEGPHEFGYFWTNWFPYNETHQTSDEDLRHLDVIRFRQELAAMESVFDAPLAFKNPIVFSLNLGAIAHILPTAVFLICHRDPIYVAQSTLLSRLQYHGRRDQWFSIKPKEYTWLKDRPYPEQLAGQAFFTEKRIKDSLRTIDSGRYLTVEYEELCEDPERELKRVRQLVGNSGYDLERTGYEPTLFACTDVQRVNDDEFERLREACDLFYGSLSRSRSGND